MFWSRYFIPTLKEVPADAELVSHKLMYRAGLIRKLASGFYTYLPLGKRVLDKVTQIIREEMNRKGALELLMPSLQPRDLWEASGRWESMGPEMMRLRNRQDRDFVLGPTHEEVITDLVAKNINSYKQMPVNFYQIQTKFRDEMRPRFGVMRAREFIMKDAYSFDADAAGAKKSYEAMLEAYTRIFHRCGCQAQVVQAATGMMGGDSSAEFMVPSDVGEDMIVTCSHCDYAANMDLARAHFEKNTSDETLVDIAEVATPQMSTVEDVSRFLKVRPEALIKTLVYIVEEQKHVVFLLRGDRTVHDGKLMTYLGTNQFRMAKAEEIQTLLGAPVGFIGPVGITQACVADPSVLTVKNGVTGANKRDTHLKGVNVERDFQIKELIDISEVQTGDVCSYCQKGHLTVSRGIEVGHVFNLGLKYSRALNASFLDEHGETQYALMGCYGIGVTRTIAAVIEVHHDQDGLCWPISVAPFHVLINVLDIDDNTVMGCAGDIFDNLTAKGIEVLMDDRTERPGVKFKDADLIGIPFIVTVGKRSLREGNVEIKSRKEGVKEMLPAQEAGSIIMDRVHKALSVFAV